MFVIKIFSLTILFCFPAIILNVINNKFFQMTSFVDFVVWQLKRIGSQTSKNQFNKTKKAKE